LIDPKVREHVQQVIQTSVTICGVHLRSVVLFGSAARGQFSEGVSDVDLILVVSDDTPNQVVRKLDTELERFEATKGPMKHRSHFLKVFAYKTALFRSHFVVKDGALRSLDTRRLFNQAGGFSLPLGRLLFSLAPADLVLRNVLRGAVVVHGENVISSLRLPDPTYSSIVQSFLVSFALSLFGALTSVLFADGTMFSLESLKWFLLDLQSHHNNRPSGVLDAVRFAEALHPSPILSQFTNLRQHYARSVSFSVLCPVYLILLFLRNSLKVRHSPQNSDPDPLILETAGQSVENNNPTKLLGILGEK